MTLSDASLNEALHDLTKLTNELQSTKLKIEAIREKILMAIEDK